MSSLLWYKRKDLLFDCLLVLSIAACLRFAFIATTEFDGDQVILFRMAYDALHHGVLPVTSNGSSIGIPQPPLVIYLYMLPALFSASPVGAAMMVSAFTTLAAGLTYLFTRRYFGRTTGLIAALLYATATLPLNYARFIWQPNMLPPFVVLYLFALFRGVYDRRPGWLVLALPLLGVMYQMHPIAAMLGLLLIVALLLAPETVCWHDWVVALVVLAVLFFPYLLHLIATNFADVHMVLLLAGHGAKIDAQALLFYWHLVCPFSNPPTYPTAWLTRVAPLVSWLNIVMPGLVVGGAILVAVWSMRGREGWVEASVREGRLTSWWMWVKQSLKDVRDDPVRSSLVLLFIWQLIPLLLLSRHQIDLHNQYFFIFLPGPFILAALCLSWLAERLRKRWSKQPITTISMYLFITCIILGQLTSSASLVFDNGEGNFRDNDFKPYHNMWPSIQNALAETERIADREHIRRIFITSDAASSEALNFLTPQMEHPVTTFDTQYCFVLPSSTRGPVLLLANPYNPLTELLLRRYARARLIEELPRIGGAPYKLYVASTSPIQTSSAIGFAHELTALSTQVETFKAGGESWLVSRWRMERSAQPAFRTSYSYTLTANGERDRTTICRMNSMEAGDQLLLNWRQLLTQDDRTTLTLQGSYGVITPLFEQYGPLRLDRYQYQTKTQQLKAIDQGPDGVVLIRQGQ